MQEKSLPASPGTYLLLLWLQREHRLVVGRLGEQVLGRGWYLYVGSAMGAGGLRGRLGHHLRKSERPHWHLDYLRQVATPREVWLLPHDASREDEWALLLGSLPGATLPIAGFGASDRRGRTHLAWLPRRPTFPLWQALCGLHLPHDPPPRRFILNATNSSEES